jgi:hypothetical protein
VQNFRKICPVGGKFHADGQTETDVKLTFALHNFVNAPKIKKTKTYI